MADALIASGDALGASVGQHMLAVAQISVARGMPVADALVMLESIHAHVLAADAPQPQPQPQPQPPSPHN